MTLACVFDNYPNNYGSSCSISGYSKTLSNKISVDFGNSIQSLLSFDGRLY